MLALAASCLALLGSAPAERPAVVLDVDLERFELRAVDGRTPGPRFRVAAGMPHTPTPRGIYRLRTLIANPSYHPGPQARRQGARPTPPSSDGPLGVAKIPFDGAFQLHGGGHRYAAGMPTTLGCVQLTDADMRALTRWLESRGALSVATPDRGELRRRFVRATRLQIH